MADVVSTIDGDQLVRGNQRVTGTSSVSPGNWVDADINASAGIAATKLEHQYVVQYNQEDGSNVAATTGEGMPVHIVYAAGGATVVAVECSSPDAPSGGGSETITVDVKRANDTPTSPTTILTGPMTIADAQADFEVVAGSIATSSLSQGDMLLVTVSIAGSGGVDGQGLIVTIILREDSA